jgi:hypothetical protein
MKLENRFGCRPDHMDMGRRMIVRVDHYPETVESKDGRHDEYTVKTQAIGI